MRLAGFLEEVLVTPRGWGEALWTAPDLAWLEQAQFYDLRAVVASARSGERVGLPSTSPLR